MNYPVVQDGVETVKSNKIGQQGISLTTSAYETFAKPFFPYLNGPYQYISPYVKKADDLGDKALSAVDEKFPVVKKPTAELYDETKQVITLPYRLSMEQKDHIIQVYTDERKNIGGEGVVPFGKAVLGTWLVVTAETLGWLKTHLAQAKQQASEKMN